MLISFKLLWNRVHILLEGGRYSESVQWLEILQHELLRDQIDCDVLEKLQR